MTLKTLENLFESYRQKQLFGRYINHDHIAPIVASLSDKISVANIGASVNNEPIYGLQFGNGKKRILMWSQMHGNESTTTKALFDIINCIENGDETLNAILESCTILAIPILNPDGARAYTRLNAKDIDLNRDAQDLSQPESKVLRKVFNDFKPHFCFNLHGQRTIFSAGKTNKTATVSFLAPAQDKATTVTHNRKRAMEIIVAMNTILQTVIPNQIGIYDDAFNLNCVGDTFQSHNIPTVLFEAGHYANDYDREKVRGFMFYAMLTAIDYIAFNDVIGDNYKDYFNIPENAKCFYDIILRNAKVNEQIVDIGIQFQEVLEDSDISFKPKIENISTLNSHFGHIEHNLEGAQVFTAEGNTIEEGYVNDFILLESDKFVLI